MLSFGALWASVAFGVFEATAWSRLWWLVPGAALVGFLAADFVSGCVHWIADTYFDPTTPVLGPLLVEPFRDHHRDPEEITRHGFLELLGNNALATLPLGVGLLLWGGPGSSLAAQALHAVVCGLAAALFATNALHCWAHSAAPPTLVAWLQRHRLVLSPEMHRRHHDGGHDRSYCVTSGWLNPLLDRLYFFARIERWVARAGGLLSSIGRANAR